jgi:mono/diheme cytochrome c family protein
MKPSPHRNRWMAWSASLLAASVALFAAGDGSPSYEKTVQPFLSKNCYMCHSAETASGDLNLQQYKSASALGQDRDRWEKLLGKLKAGEMPPPGMPRPDAAELKAVIAWIEGEFARIDASAKPDPGRVTAHRLNRTEYNNTVRDLLGVDLDPANDFPQDDAVYGFDDIANALTVSPLLMEKYLAAAEKVTRTAIFGPDLKSTPVRFAPPIPRRQEGANPLVITAPWPYTADDYDVTGISVQGAYHLTYKIPADGTYLLRMTTTNVRPPGSEPEMLDLYIDGKIVHSFEVPEVVTQTNEKVPTAMEYEWKATAGPHEFICALPRMFEGLPASFKGPNPSHKVVPAGRGGIQLPPLPADATPEQIAQREAILKRIEARNSKFDGISMSDFEIVGPSSYKKGPSAESLRKIYTCGHLDGNHQPGCERKIISSMAERAFRRPVTTDEVNDFVSVYSSARTRGRSFDQGIALATEAILVSPDFLFRIEKSAPVKNADAVQPVGEFELASRLSYFLWSTMPDDELMRAAKQGTLRKPEVLEAQVRRMLSDPKAHALAENFAGQWLEIRRLESVHPDRDRFPDFDDYLRDSMLQETQRFFENIVSENRSILDFIDGQYSFLNEKLARFYGIKGVKGPEFRKVDLTGTGRTGILTQASVLTVSSYGNRTSPVLRGKWILENLLNTPPPPPPPDVPALEEEAIGATVSMRQQLEKHRANAVCASCHSRMDPLGFSLENYDATGSFRTMDGKFPIDNSGVLPDGRKFEGALGLKAILDSNPKAFAQCLAEKMLIYALGRGVTPADRTTVQQIADALAANQYRFSSLVLGIVKSAPFQMQRVEGTQP